MIEVNDFINRIKPNNKRFFRLFLIILFSSLFFLLISIFSFLKYLNYYINTPIAKNENIVKIEIKSGESVREIATDLEENGLIKNKNIFLFYLKYEGVSSELKAGEYSFSYNQSPKEIIDTLMKGNDLNRKITIPEGWTNLKIAEYLDEQNVVDKEGFLSSVQEDYNYDFLRDLPEGIDLEGFLFPDTYEIDNNISADEIVKMMLDNFDRKLTDQIRTQINNSKYNIFEIVTLASIVEREVANDEDRALVAGVFLNRLSIDMPLESCATIQYILNKSEKQFTYEETRTPSPYNTYLNRGLPLGPIGNPGIDSIKAVLNPTESDYLYFLSANGKTYYSRTLDEHNEKKAIYL